MPSSRVKFASLSEDGWELRNGEDAHRANPDTFWIPSFEIRSSRKRGDGVKLVFVIKAMDENGADQSGGERMWVIVLERAGEHYLGLLDNEPVSIEPRSANLSRGSRVWFGPEHIIDTSEVPPAYLRESFPEEFAT